MTAQARTEQDDGGAEAGMDDFLGKPLDCQQLYAVLDRHLLAAANASCRRFPSSR